MENRKISQHPATTSLTSGYSFTKLKLNYVYCATAATKHEVKKREFKCVTLVKDYNRLHVNARILDLLKVVRPCEIAGTFNVSYCLQLDRVHHNVFCFLKTTLIFSPIFVYFSQVISFLHEFGLILCTDVSRTPRVLYASPIREEYRTRKFFHPPVTSSLLSRYSSRHPLLFLWLIKRRCQQLRLCTVER